MFSGKFDYMYNKLGIISGKLYQMCKIMSTMRWNSLNQSTSAKMKKPKKNLLIIVSNFILEYKYNYHM